MTKTKGGRKRQLGDQHGGGGSLSDLTAAADSIDGGGARPVYRKRGAGWGNKLCPACGQANTMGRLSCVLCGAKFSVRVTRHLKPRGERPTPARARRPRG